MGTLRFILAIAVVIAHSGPLSGFAFVSDQLAVQTFYIISGFYMTLVLNEKYIGVNDSYKLFISNRLLRLYPIYWTVLILTICGSIGVYLYSGRINYGKFSVYAEYFHLFNFKSAVFLAFTNLFLFLQDFVMFLGLDVTSGDFFLTTNFRETTPQVHQFLFVPQAWTIGLEISFYLMAPFLVRRKLIVIIPLIIAALILRIILLGLGLNHDPWSYRFLPTELVFFLLGIVSYKIYTTLRSKTIHRVVLISTFLGILLFSVFFGFLQVPYKYAAYLFVIFMGLPFIFILTKSWTFDRYIGELSYPIYISHVLIMSCIGSLNLPLLFGMGFTLTVASIFFSVLLHELVAKKIEKVRQKRLRPV